MSDENKVIEQLEELARALEFIDDAKEALTPEQQIDLTNAIFEGLTPGQELEEEKDEGVEPTN